jgi:hypothetical protein
MSLHQILKAARQRQESEKQVLFQNLASLDNVTVQEVDLDDSSDTSVTNASVGSPGSQSSGDTDPQSHNQQVVQELNSSESKVSLFFFHAKCIFFCCTVTDILVAA